MKFEEVTESVLNGLAKDKTLQDLSNKHKVSLEEIQKEHKKGTEVELEHTSSWEIAAEIAKDHLFEDPQYYTKLAKTEKK
jgi:hypothetical protein